MNTDTAANDLTQLSSREQLSALMDGALPPDQTRFLLRRLQHDAPLAECWERWRLTGEVMRGLAPAQRLPADFASRVSAALHGELTAVPQDAATSHRPAWLRWGGGAAMAASLALVALMARQPAIDTPAAADAIQLASAAAPVSEAPNPSVPATQAPADAAQAVLAATAAAATARPLRNRTTESRTPMRMQPAVARDSAAESQVAAASELPIPQPDIVTRPWPRSVLPQYASGGLTVGFGDHARGATAYNPFQSQAGIGAMSPISANATDGDATGERQASNPEPQP